ncbi:MAG TPA: F0F1 ATP synthase subunit B [Candidatus Limnocylindrales bacterium]|nr:F0F1 ATP synthase subunit B [Candidatus Limnocylindrales bacterium]
MDLFAVAGAVSHGAIALAAEGEPATEAGLQINLFWVIVSSLNFIVFAVILYWLFGGPLSRMLAERRARIQQGLEDAEEARRAREAADQERIAALQEARREANDILTRAQKLADESRERDLAAAREEVERVRSRATADLEAEKQRAINEIRAEVADLALKAAGRVVGETMNDDRQRRLVEEFLQETSAGDGSAKG